MLPTSFWHVTAQDIAALDPKEAVAVMAELLRSEAHRLHVPATNVSVPSQIEMADGGLDAEVRDAATDGEAIFAGVTGYQIKTGAFKLGSSGSIRELLLRPSSATKRSNLGREDLNERILGLAEEHGTFVVVLFGSDAPPQGHTDARVKDRIAELLSSVDPALWFREVRIWRQSQIAALIDRHAGLVLRVKRLRATRLRSLASWAELPEMRTVFVPGPEQKDFMDDLRKLLAESSERAIRILGEPGVGKTRLVLEALKAAEHLRSLVVYAQDPEVLKDDAALSQLEQDSSIRGILVVDECSPESRSQLLRRLATKFRERVRIVTIYYHGSEQDTEDSKLEAPRLADEHVASIIGGYINDRRLQLWASWCDGSPRMAHIVGKGLRDHPDNIVSNRDDLLHAFIRGALDGGNERALRIVYCLALFRKFGFGGHVSGEGDFIYEKVLSLLDQSIPKAEYNTTIRRLRDCRVLQGSLTLYFTPRLLHLWLWSQWWKIGTDRDYAAIWETLQDQPALSNWFADTLAYAHGSQDVVSAIRALFGAGRSLHDFPDVPIRAAPTLFLNAARVAPAEALTVLEQNLGRRTTDQLRAFEAGRHEVVSALRVIAGDAKLFDRAAKLLLALAEAENQSYSNNATGTFKDLFRLGVGDYASSQLEPSARLSILVEIARGSSLIRRSLARGAFAAALDTDRIVLVELDHPLHRSDKLWAPGTWGEVFDALFMYWDALVALLPEIPPNERPEWTQCVLSRFGGLVRYEAIAQRVIDRLEEALRAGVVPRDAAALTIDNVVDFSGKDLNPGLIDRLLALRSEALGSDFEARLRRCVAQRLRGLEEEGEDAERSGFESVVREVLARPSLLDAHLQWLVSANLRNGYAFGKRLARDDLGFSVFWPRILQVLTRERPTDIGPFARGYLAGVFARDPARWEAMIGQLDKTDLPRSTIAALLVRTGMTPSVGAMLADWVANGHVAPTTVPELAWGGPDYRLPPDDMRRCLNALLRRTDLAAAVAALDTVCSAQHPSAVEFEDALIGRVLLNPPLFGSTKPGLGLSQILEYKWTRAADRWAGGRADRLVQLVEELLRTFGTERGIFQTRGESRKLLSRAFRAAPDRAWELIARALASGDRVVSYALSHWLGDGRLSAVEETDEPPPTELLPRKAILSWVKALPDTRARLAAEIAPAVRDAGKWSDSLARELLVHFGDRQDVQSALKAGYFTDNWVGPASLHYQGRRSHINAMLQSETNALARRWLTAIDQDLDSLIEDAKAEEERWF
jgi:hypothetical protein